MKFHSQRGSAIIMLFIAVALFAALAYAFMQGTRGSLSMLEGEEDDAMVTQSQDCMNAINMATKRLEAKGCGSLISSEADGSNSDPDAPADGSCAIYHPNGGGVKSSCATPACDIASLANAGDICGDIVYLGTISGGQKTYTGLANLGKFSYNNGSVFFNSDLSATTSATGEVATDYLLGLSNGESPYNAAEACRNIGPEWFLPTYGELLSLYGIKASIPGLPEDDLYWSASGWPGPNTFALPLNMANGAIPPRDKSLSFYVRCFRYE